MSASSWNILYRPAARLAVKSMKDELSIPYIHLPGAYGLKTIDKNYQLLEDLLKRKLDTAAYREKTCDFLSDNQKNVQGMRVAVGASVYTGPFELVRALTEYGLDVQYVFANIVIDFDSEHIQWLKEFKPDLMIYPSSHTSMAQFHSLNRKVDLAFGYEAGYFCSEARTVNLSAEKPYFGYYGIQSLFEEIMSALDSPRSHKQLMNSTYYPERKQPCEV